MARAAFLSYVLLTDEAVIQLYEALKIGPEIFQTPGAVTEYLLPEEIPKALTNKGVYVKLVCRVYAALQKACDEYIHGKLAEDLQKDDPETLDAGYNMVVEMHRIINERIAQMNNEMRPGQTLRYFKRFNPDAETKADVTGGMTFGASGSMCRINQALCFEPIDFKALKIKIYPPLPPLEKAEDRIESLCAKLYGRHPEQVKSLIADLKNRCRNRNR
jgi:hypothetical protein